MLKSNLAKLAWTERSLKADWTGTFVRAEGNIESFNLTRVSEDKNLLVNSLSCGSVQTWIPFGWPIVCIHNSSKRLQYNSSSYCFLPIPLPPDCRGPWLPTTTLPVKAMPHNHCQLAKGIKGIEKNHQATHGDCKAVGSYIVHDPSRAVSKSAFHAW